MPKKEGVIRRVSADDREVLAGGARRSSRMPTAPRKTCDRCGDTEWPCFLVDDLCRMCQARRRDERRASEKIAKEPR